MRYRPEIDGLRTVAVVPVVLYHAGFTTLSGGFTGVDIFFVISGYLIARIILDEVAAGQFTFLNFYERRIRRIIPVLVVVVAATLAGASMVALPDQLASTGKSAIAAMLSVSNIWFWSQTGYFAPSAEFIPLLHTWSLAVEEQFYLVLPLLIVLMARLRIPIRLVLVIVALPAFATALWLSHAKPSVAFFLLPARAWELGLGVMLAAGVFPQIRSRIGSELAAAAGLGLIVTGLFWIHEGMVFPGWVALLPCVGAALVLHATSGPETFVGRLLSLRVMVFVGLISYSLYLWHWPVFTLMRLHGATLHLSFGQAVAGTVLSFILAVASWRYVERPFRRGMSFVRVARLLSIGAAAISAGAVILIATGGLPGRLNEDASRMLTASTDIDPFTEICADGLTKQECQFGPVTEPVRYLLVGDSHAAALRPIFDREIAGLSGRGALSWMGGCPLLQGAWMHLGGSRASCLVFKERILDQIKSFPDVHTVILGGRWAYQMSGVEIGSGGSFRNYLVDQETVLPSPAETLSVFERALGQTIDELGRMGKRVILLGVVPIAGFDVPSSLALGLLNGSRAIPTAIEYNAADFRAADALFSKITSSRRHARYVPIWDILCNEDCPILIDGVPLYFDDDHLTAQGASTVLGPAVGERIAAALQN